MSDAQLMQEMQKPSGIAPLDLVSTELRRRQRMRMGMVPNVKKFANRGLVEAYDSDAEDHTNAIARRLGIDGEPMNLKGTLEQITEALPNRADPEFAALIEETRADREEARRANRGRMLMEAGFAMMQSKNPSFWGAVGEGGEAGLRANEQHRAENRQLTAAERQARMARAQSASSMDAARLGGATNMLSAARTAMGSAINAGYGAAGAKAQLGLGMEELEARAREGALDRGVQLQIAAMRDGKKDPSQMSKPELYIYLGEQFDQLRREDRPIDPRTNEQYTRAAWIIHNMAAMEHGPGHAAARVAGIPSEVTRFYQSRVRDRAYNTSEPPGTSPDNPIGAPSKASASAQAKRLGRTIWAITYDEDNTIKRFRFNPDGTSAAE